MKKRINGRGWLFFLLLCIVLVGTSCSAVPSDLPPAEPILAFSEQNVQWKAGTEVYCGTLSRDLQQRAVLTVLEPEALKGFTWVSSQTGMTLRYEGLSAAVSSLPGAAGQLLAALDAASLPEALVSTETGFTGRLSDGTIYVLTTDTDGNLETLRLPDAEMTFLDTEG